MGGFLSMFYSKKDFHMCMLGLDAAGKSTILYKMKLNELVHTIPTVGFNVESLKYKNLDFTIWDIGGQDKIRSLWRYYYNQNDAIIFVIDSDDELRLDIAADELNTLLNEPQLAESKLLVFANKQDLSDAVPVKMICDRLGLHKLRNREWYIQSCSALNGDGLHEGFDWLSKALKAKK
mmetsp:Transcript_20392/g.23110  ORF Transcript_20392/g.23110 Transcript_20392/m.23110 type:complete len:178 (+) Transcript_20392:208-741(+)